MTFMDPSRKIDINKTLENKYINANISVDTYINRILADITDLFNALNTEEIDGITYLIVSHIQDIRHESTSMYRNGSTN